MGRVSAFNTPAAANRTVNDDNENKIMSSVELNDFPRNPSWIIKQDTEINKELEAAEESGAELDVEKGANEVETER